MAWGKAGSDTLTGTGDLMTITDLPANLSNFFISHTLASGQTEPLITFNNDTGSNYAYRYSSDGGSDSTQTSGSNVFTHTASNTTDNSWLMYCINISAEEKLFLMWSMGANTAGAGNAPTRREYACKWVNTSAQITEIDATNGGTGDFLTGSNITALGSDITPASAIPFPENVELGSRAEITDTRKMYNYTAPATAPTTTSHFEGHGQQPVDVSDTIDIPTTGLSNLSTGSVSFWIYLETESTSNGDYVVISASNDTQASREFALGFVGHVTGVGIICRNGSGICTFTCPSSLTRNAWNHVVYTNNSSGNKVYVNGSQVTPSYSVGSASTNAFFGTVGTNNTCTIGANKDNVSGGYYQWGFDGNLQQLLVYSAVLTQAEITALYNNGKYSEPSTTNLLRRYELTSNANDTSGNGHNGTATSGVTYTSLAIPEGSNEWKEIGT